MTAPLQHEYSNNLGVRLLSDLAERGAFIFTTAEAKAAASRLRIPEGYLSQLLPRLVRSGWLMGLRRGLYAGTGSLPGAIEIHPFAVATRLVTPSAVSHWSAMDHHGLTSQVPREVTAFTPRKVVTPSMRGSGGAKAGRKHAWEVRGLRYEYTTVRPAHFFGIEEVWVDENFRVPVTDRERTVLEGFVSFRTFGGIGEVLGALEEHVHELDLARLVAYALRYGKASVAKRLGWALERVGVKGRVVAPLAQLPVSGFRILDPTRPARGPCDRRWGIQDNLTPGKRG